MSTVQGAKPCPRCGCVMSYDFNCSTQEEWRFCEGCGLTQDWHLDRDENGRIVTSESAPYGTMVYKESGGYGVLHEIYPDGNGRITPFNTRHSYRAARAAVKWLKSHAGELSVKDCSVTCWDQKAKRIRALFGPAPMTYEEFDTLPCGNDTALGVTVTKIDDDPDNDLPF